MTASGTIVNGIDLEVLYTILREAARKKKPITYGTLSQVYTQKTGMWREPHGTWDYPLGALNNWLHRAGLPAITVLVVTAETMEPGSGFWGSCPLVPARSTDGGERLAACVRIQAEVYNTRWPFSLPAVKSEA